MITALVSEFDRRYMIALDCLHEFSAETATNAQLLALILLDTPVLIRIDYRYPAPILMFI